MAFVVLLLKHKVLSIALSSFGTALSFTNIVVGSVLIYWNQKKKSSLFTASEWEPTLFSSVWTHKNKTRMMEKARVYGKPQEKAGTHVALVGWWVLRGHASERLLWSRNGHNTEALWRPDVRWPGRPLYHGVHNCPCVCWVEEWGEKLPLRAHGKMLEGNRWAENAHRGTPSNSTHYPAFVSTSCICTLTDIASPPYPPFDCIWFWMEFTEFMPVKRSPEPTWAVWTKLVGSPIILRSIRLRLFGCGCSAIQQLKHNQNSLMTSRQSWSAAVPVGPRGLWESGQGTFGRSSQCWKRRCSVWGAGFKQE